MRQPKPQFSVEYRTNRKPSGPKVFDLTEESDYEFNQDEDYPAEPELSSDDAYEQALRAADAAFEKREVDPAMQRRKQEPAPFTAPKAPPKAHREPSRNEPVVPNRTHAAAEKVFAKAPEAPVVEARRILPDLTENPVVEAPVAKRRGRPPKQKNVEPSFLATPPLVGKVQPEKVELPFIKPVVRKTEKIASPVPIDEILSVIRHRHTFKVRDFTNQPAISAARRTRWAGIRPVPERRRQPVTF